MNVSLRRSLLGQGTWEPLTDKWFELEGAWLGEWLEANL